MHDLLSFAEFCFIMKPAKDFLKAEVNETLMDKDVSAMLQTCLGVIFFCFWIAAVVLARYLLYLLIEKKAKANVLLKKLLWGDKMQFNYYNPKSETELTALLNGMEDYCLLAGGTDIMVKMKEKLIAPKNLVDVSGITTLKGIRESGDSIWIGSMATHRELMDSALINKKTAALCLAAGEVGSPQIRNAGTVGGNIGNASPAADTVPVLLVLDAKVQINSATGPLEVPLAKVLVGPGKTCLQPGQYIAGVSISAVAASEGAAFAKFGKRRALACSIVNGAAWIQVRDGVISGVRIALGSVGPTAVRLYDIEKSLLGQKADPALFAEAGLQAEQCVRPIDDVRCTASHRGKLARVAVRRCLEAAAKQALEVCVCE